MNDPGVATDYAPLGNDTEFNDLTLPRDMFNSFRYFFVTHSRFISFLVLDLTIIGICLVWFEPRRLDFDSKATFTIVAFLTTFITLFPAFIEDEDIDGVRKDTRNSLSFLGEVVKIRPGLDENKWNLIAARSNRAFHHNDNKITPYFFYDGANCRSFLTLLLQFHTPIGLKLRNLYSP